MLEIDNNSSYGTVEIRVSGLFTNMAEVIWNGNTGANIFFRCNCTSTAFAPHKHGGEKGIHMRFQIDTFELNPNVAASFQSNLTINCNDYQTSSILSPPNSSSSPVSNKFAKDELDNASSSFQQQSQRRLPTPSPLTEPSNWKHACSSYCRIQLFRLKGAQRKLKTDRSKIERLNPSDLRKRYQPSSKVTLLYNCPFDPLYSMMPLPRDVDNARHYCHHHQTQLDPSSAALDPCVHGLPGMDYLRNSISNDIPNMYHIGSSNSIASSASSLYNTPNYGLQPIPAESVHHSQLGPCTTDLMQNMGSMGYQSQAQTPSQPLINNYDAGFGPTTLANDEYHHFYLDANQNTYNSQLMTSNNFFLYKG